MTTSTPLTHPGYPRIGDIQAEIIINARFVGAARTLHSRGSVEVLPRACAEGECDHPGDGAYGHLVSCPPRDLGVCDHCWGMLERQGYDEHPVPDDALWPCKTAVALGATPIETKDAS